MFNRRNHFSVERGHKKRNRNMMKQSQGSDPWNTRLLLPVTPFLNCGCSHDQDTLKCPFLFENRIESTYRIDPILHLTRFCSCCCHLQCKIDRQAGRQQCCVPYSVGAWYASNCLQKPLIYVFVCTNI